jgi:hypothetical protein
MMAAPRTDQPKAPPWEARCKSCGGWVGTVPAGTAWFRGRCGNRSVLGQPGRKCALYGQTQTFRCA